MRARFARMGRRACAIAGSVGIPDSVDEMFAEFGKHFDRLDILVSATPPAACSSRRSR